MTVIINGTSGITSVNGSAAAPSVTGTDTDTGIVYGTNTLSLATGGTTALTANSSQGIQVLNTIGVGNATPSTSGAGITFPSTDLHYSTNANTLDDYEEGTWTPFIGGSSTDPTITYVVRYGYYVKVGRMLFVSGYVYSTNMSGGTGTLLLAGLPFSVLGGPNGAYQFLPIGYNTYNGAANVYWRFQMGGNLTYGSVYSSAGGVNLPNSSSTVEFSFSGVFMTT